MGRPKSSVRISFKGPKSTYRLNLSWCPITKQFVIYRDGSKSKRLPSASATRIGQSVSQWLQSQVNS